MDETHALLKELSRPARGRHGFLDYWTSTNAEKGLAKSSPALCAAQMYQEAASLLIGNRVLSHDEEGKVMARHLIDR